MTTTLTTRLFLVAPESIADDTLLACAKAAARAADCACILVGETVSKPTVEALQALNLAVLLKDAEPRKVHHLHADGLLLSSPEAFKEARAALKSESLGLIAGVSRHAAMEAAEAGADVVAFTQTKQYVGEPIINWWQDVTDLPAIALDPVTDANLKPQNPDFIRPSDDMWQNAESAAQVVSDLWAKWTA
jgi:thiamine-phosphate pyrophosphorylase